MARAAVEAVGDLCECTSLGMVPVKGKGELEIFRFSRWR